MPIGQDPLFRCRPAAALALSDATTTARRRSTASCRNSRSTAACLALAQDPAIPLLERLRFLCIVGSNLDEFFEIRVAGLKEQLRAQLAPPGLTLPGLRALLGIITDETRMLVAEQYRLLNYAILPALAEARHPALAARRAQRRAARVGFRLFPARSEAAADADRARSRASVPAGRQQEPQFHRRAVGPRRLRTRDDDRHGQGAAAAAADHRIAARTSRGVDNTVRAALRASSTRICTSSSAAARSSATSQFRVTRDADLWFDEEEVKNLRQALEGELPQRHFGLAVRLEVAAGCPQKLAQFLLRQFELDRRRPLSMRRSRQPGADVGADRCGVDHGTRLPALRPGLPDRLRKSTDLLATIRQHDVLLHHPFQSFDPVVEFIRKAADDPDVVAIKQTVYRTGVNSVLMEALIEAARRGKEVTVVVELLARFDEEANINWAEKLEQVGAQVVYGVFGLKTHAKLALLLRREVDAKGRTRLQSYAHLGTGNYHPRTARLYTDFGLLTANQAICADVNDVFLHITSLAKAKRLKHLLLAPFTMHDRVLDAIGREARTRATASRRGSPPR